MFPQSECIMNTDSTTHAWQISVKTNMIIKKSKNFLDNTGCQRMNNNKIVELCDQAYHFQTANLTHTHTQAVRLTSSANKTVVLPTQGIPITQPMCWTYQLKRDHMNWAHTDNIKMHLNKEGHM